MPVHPSCRHILRQWVPPANDPGADSILEVSAHYGFRFVRSMKSMNRKCMDPSSVQTWKISRQLVTLLAYLFLLAFSVWACHTHSCIAFTFATKVLVVVGHDFEEICSGVDCRLLPSSVWKPWLLHRKMAKALYGHSKRPCVDSIKTIAIETKTFNTFNSTY